MAADTGGRPAKAAPDGPGPPRVRRRRLFYVAGFDPASPRKYHAMFTAQSALQAAVTGARIEVGPMEKRDPLVTAWRVSAEHGGERTETDYQFLHWFEPVRAAWPKDGPGLFLGAWSALIDYFRSGIMARARKEAPAAWYASLAPVVIGTAFVALFGLAVFALCAAGGVLAAKLGWPWPVLAVPPLALWLLAPWVWGQLHKVLAVGWLARGMIAVTRAARGEIPAFAEHADAFADRLLAAAGEPGWDEILVVGHSMGGQQAGRALGRAVLTDPDFGRAGPPVNFLTLGSLLPFYSMTARDEAYRREMAALVAADRIGWIDVTGPSDPGCAAALHPLAGLDLGEPEGRPVRRSPRFHLLMSPDAYRKLKREPLAFHFHYLMATEIAGDYDFFRMTTGPDLLTHARSAAAP